MESCGLWLARGDAHFGDRPTTLERVAALAPKALVPGRAHKPFVLVLENGPIHASKLAADALAARRWITVEWLPRNAPELDDIELSWRDLKLHHLAHRTFKDADHLGTTTHSAVADMNRERATPHSCDNQRIAA